jgi:hypothetical protein
MRLNPLAFLFVMLLWSLPANAENPSRSAITKVIGAQLDAFKRDDAAAAFAIASPEIQAMFGTPEKFLNMVAVSYAPVYRSQETTFLDLLEQDGTLIQRVLFTGSGGGQVLALYTMSHQADGTWRIGGCVLVQASGEEA